MKSNLLTFVFALSFLTITNLGFSQKNFDATLDALLNSEFMRQYQEMRTSAMASATAFRNSANASNQQNGGGYNTQYDENGNPIVPEKLYSQKDIQRVEEGYNKVADKFNFVLLRLKNDMLNKDKMNHIVKYPEDYERLLRLDMMELRDFYAVNYQQVLAEVTGEEVDGAVLFLLSDVLLSTVNVYQLVKSLVEYIKFNKRRAKKMRETELDKRLVEPHKFLMWYELGQQNQNMNGGFDNRAMEEVAPQDQFQFQGPSGQGYGKQNRGPAMMPDRDGDGVADTQDRCPDEYGERSAFGCPDSDGDGTADNLDKCKYQYGNGPDGCPLDEGQSFNGSVPLPNNNESSSQTGPQTDSNGEIMGSSKIKIKVPKTKKENEVKKKNQ